MASNRDLPDLEQLEARLLADRQAYYDRIAAQRSTIDTVAQEDRNLHAFLQERLERLLSSRSAP